MRIVYVNYWFVLASGFYNAEMIRLIKTYIDDADIWKKLYPIHFCYLSRKIQRIIRLRHNLVPKFFRLMIAINIINWAFLLVCVIIIPFVRRWWLCNVLEYTFYVCMGEAFALVMYKEVVVKYFYK